MTAERDAIVVFLKNRRFLAIYALAFAGWLGVALGWFWISDAHAAAVIFGAALAPIIIATGLVLLGLALNYYLQAHQNRPPTLKVASQLTVHRMPALLVWAGLVGVLVWAYIFRPDWSLAWMLLLALLIRTLGGVATDGFDGFMSRPGGLIMLVEIVGLMILGVWLPYKLAGWRPQLTGFTAETVSLLLRLVLGYLAGLTAWLLTASLLAKRMAERHAEAN